MQVKLSRSGPGWSVTPTVHAKGFEVDLLAATSLGDKTKASFDCKHGGAATVCTMKIIAFRDEGEDKACASDHALVFLLGFFGTFFSI